MSTKQNRHEARIPLRSNQFIAYRGTRGGVTIATVTSIWQLPQHEWWYGAMTLSRRNNGVKHCCGIIPTRLALRNNRLRRETAELKN